jgi:hypothetical protein
MVMKACSGQTSGVSFIKSRSGSPPHAAPLLTITSPSTLHVFPKAHATCAAAPGSYCASLVGVLGVDLLAGELLVRLAHAVGLCVSLANRTRCANQMEATHDLLAHAAVARDFLALRAAEFLRAGFERLVDVVFLASVVVRVVHAGGF